MSAAALLDRLAGVRQTGVGRWLAKCPAHADRSPSLSIRELDDGRVLLHDFGGCDVQAVLESIGLSMSDLFPERLPGSGPAGGYPASHSRIPAADALRAIDREISVAALLLESAASGTPLHDADMTRLRQAAARVGAARDLCCRGGAPR
jgi:hypothetical protein